MHTFSTEDVPKFVIHHNGDFSGDVIIRYYASASREGSTKDNQELKVPFELLKQLVAEYVRQARISALEHASAADIFEVSD